MRTISNQLVKKSIDLLKQIMDRPEAEGKAQSDYEVFWESFGKFIKLGVVEDEKHRCTSSVPHNPPVLCTSALRASAVMRVVRSNAQGLIFLLSKRVPLRFMRRVSFLKARASVLISSACATGQMCFMFRQTYFFGFFFFSGGGGTHRRALAPLLRLTSSKSGEGLTSLAQYKERMKEGQKSIYYIAAENLDAAASAPFVEQLIKKDLEVSTPCCFLLCLRVALV